MDNNFEIIIKESLLDEVNTFSHNEDFFSRIKERIESGNRKSNKKFKNYSLGFGYRKHITIAAYILIVCITLMFAASQQARVLASQTISSIKTIFILEKVDNKLQIVEKLSNEVFSTFSVGATSQGSDEEISEKLGFKASFPEYLGNIFKLGYKSLGVTLKKQISQEICSTIQNDMLNAIEDDNMLMLLKPYDAMRFASVAYRRTDNSTIFINVSQVFKLTDIESRIKEYQSLQEFSIQKVKIDNLDGYWLKSPYLNYPLIVKNGMGIADMSVKPEIKEQYTLYWEKSDIVYTLHSDKDFKLSLKEALKLAEEFMKSN